MVSTSDSDYISACIAFLEPMNQRPGMFFDKLSDLETMMHGHACAFQQIGILSDSSGTFNKRFSQWLVEIKSCSASAGWAVAIEELAKCTGVEPLELFLKLKEEFVGYWARPKD